MKKLKLLFAACALLVTAGVQAQKDVTSQYITNATLSSLDGWTNVNFNAPVKGNNTTGYASECYAGWGSIEKASYSLTQTITLPAGHYTLVNYSFYRYGLNADTDATLSYASLKAGEQTVPIKTLGSIPASGYANSQAEGANAFDSKMYRNTLDFTIDADNTSIEIGLVGTHELKQSWMICGMFELINNDIPATMDAPFDVTGYITNPGFEYRNMTGWTQSENDFFGTQNNSQSFKVGGYYAEKWQASGALPEGNFTQTLTNLPAGFYKLTANLGGDGTYIDMNGKTANWTADKDYTIGYVLAENEALTITAGKTAEGTANWIHFDNFRLQFCGDVAAALTTLCAEVSEYESKLSADDYSTLQTAVAGYNKNYSDVDDLLAAIDAVQALYDAADLYIEYTDALTAAQAVDQTAPMNADVLSALQAAISTSVSMSSSAADVVAAKNALNTATANANTSIANYTEAKTILDAANTYDETGQASYAADETIAAIQSAYDDGSLTALTTDQKTAAQTALATACKAQTQPADGCDMTAYVQNWDFLNCAKDNFPNWTISKSAGTAQNFGTTAAEYWNGSAAGGEFDFYQNVTDLPVGVYTIQGNMWNSTDNESGAAGVDGECGVYGISSSADVFAGVTVDTRDGGKATYTTEDIVVIDGKLRLGVKNKATMGGRWFGVDWIKLTYSRQLNADELEEIEMETAKKAYEEALAAAQGITEGSIPTSAYSTLQGIINDNTLSEGATTTDYNNAASALNSATDDATPLVVPYAAWKALKAQADALVIVSNDNEEANSTLTTAISTQESAADAATTATEINTATSELKSAMTTYVGAANPVGDGAQFDCTFMLSDNDLTGYTSRQKLSSWYTDQTFNSQNSQTMTDNPSVANSSDNTKYAMYEYWSGSVEATSGYTVYQKYTLPAGTYRMDALCCVGYGWATRYEDASTRNTNITFSAGDVDGTNITTGTLEPATLEFVQASESEVKIGLKAQAGNTANWMGIGYVELYKIPAQAFTVDEDVAWNYEQSGAGDVTLNRTIKAGVNTLVLPFSMTQDEVESTFGEGSVVYVVDSYDSDKNSISFKQKSGISPNEPCLLKAAEEGTSYSLLGRTIVAASANPTIGGTDVTMTGSYAATAYIPLNSYVVNGGNLYKVDQEESVSMKNTRAYITVPKSADARTITISFDNGATGIATLDGGEMKFEAGTIYDLSGRKVTNPAKGIYIMNGKKVIK